MKDDDRGGRPPLVLASPGGGASVVGSAAKNAASVSDGAYKGDRAYSGVDADDDRRLIVSASTTHQPAPRRRVAGLQPWGGRPPNQGAAGRRGGSVACERTMDPAHLLLRLALAALTDVSEGYSYCFCA